jgi:hypothetical protein
MNKISGNSMIDVNKKFGYTMIFRSFNAEKNMSGWEQYAYFASADTAIDAISNLSKIFDGSIPYRQLLGEGSRAKLTVIELISDGEKLITLRCTEDTEKKLRARAQWSLMRFDDVNKELLDALIQTFPEQKQFFKGKHLEGALGL